MGQENQTRSKLKIEPGFYNSENMRSKSHLKQHQQKEKSQTRHRGIKWSKQRMRLELVGK